MHTEEKDTSKRILEAALNLISQNGYAQVSMRDIAQEAGVAISQISYHYKNKEGLFIALIRQLKEARDRGIVVVNITQCQSGAVEMGRYETGLQLLQAGVISGYDSTPECAVTKLMFLLGHGLTQQEIRERMNSNLAGEITKHYD